MALAPGTQLGPYEITAALGAGGMGEVYRARDTRLDRTVAIKILPAEVAKDAVRKQRFEREAKTISSLNHPNICTLHDIGSQDGVDFLVMECVEGESLAKRLEKGPLPLEQVLKHGAQVADALDKAHRAGIVHRDLKPGNIMLAASGTKLLDFGLAKAAAPITSVATLTGVVTQDSPVTQQGTIVGTFQYMAPEQVEGKEVDGRSDIFSLGAVLYETLTGKKAFEGKSQLSVASAILEKEPAPITATKPLTPPALDHAIRKCLAKSPDERWQSASDLGSELSWILASGSQAAASVPWIGRRRQQERVAWIGAGVVLALLVGYLGWRGGPGGHRNSPLHLTVALPSGKALRNYNSTRPVAITPDGSAIVYAAAGEDRKNQLYLRKLDSFESTPIAGTEDAFSPFFSPNGQWVGFFTNDNKMKKVLLQGGSPVVLEEASFLGGSWGDDDIIYFKKSFASGISAVPAGGGQTREVTRTGSRPDDRAHIWPDALPGNNGIVFTVWTGRSFNDARIEGLSFKTGERKVLVEGGTDGRYLANGYLAYARNGTLFAVPFDPKRLEVEGAPVPLLEGVMSGAANGDADFAVSDNGTLVFLPGTFTSFQRNLVWMDRTGKITNVTSEVKPYGSPAISPDGQRIALALQGSSFDVWVYDLGRGTLTKASFGGDDYRPEWSPDGKMLAYDSSKSGHQQVYVKHGIVQGDETAVTDSPEDKEFYGWTPNGREVIFARLNKETGWDLYAAGAEGDHKLRPLVVAPFNQKDARLSPDGKWLAYVSDESGQPEVFVQEMSESGTRAQVSTDGGITPQWTRSGNELLFRSKNQVMSVKVSPGGALNLGKPIVLFEDKKGWNGYDIAADGSLVIARDADEKGTVMQINVVLHWFEEMKKK
jgi:Tol biopolymer transport system component